MPTAKVNGVELYYETHGESGEPLVLVHGYTGDLTDWRHQAPEFSRSHRLLLLELRGHGRSEAPSEHEAYSIDTMADDVEALIGHAGFDRYHLVGHSMGGAISQEIALRSSQRLLSLTIHDSGHNFSLPEAARRWFDMRLRVAAEKGMRAVADIPSPFPLPPHGKQERRDEERERLARMSPHGFIGAWRALSGWRGSTDRAAKIDVPTLIICGELDSPAIVGGARWFAENIRGATLAMIPEAGHAPQYERPDLFNAALRAHLERVAAAAR